MYKSVKVGLASLAGFLYEGQNVSNDILRNELSRSLHPACTGSSMWRKGYVQRNRVRDDNKVIEGTEVMAQSRDTHKAGKIRHDKLKEEL
jgi:hypothetical protein